MNGSSLLADTNVIIYLLNGDEKFVESLENKNIYLSFITEIELLSRRNLNVKELTTIQKLIENSYILDLNNQIKTETIRFRKKYNLKIPDAIIAATSYYHNVPLITSDQDFTKLQELDIIYYE